MRTTRILIVIGLIAALSPAQLSVFAKQEKRGVAQDEAKKPQDKSTQDPAAKPKEESKPKEEPKTDEREQPTRQKQNT